MRVCGGVTRSPPARCSPPDRGPRNRRRRLAAASTSAAADGDAVAGEHRDAGARDDPATRPGHAHRQITNRSQETWHALNVYMLTSPTPIRSRAELAKAARSDADSQVGARRAATRPVRRGRRPAHPVTSVAYRLSVRRRDLGISGEAGVYWVGVHVLGAGDGGKRDTVADGRARTFMPLLPAPRSAAGAAGPHPARADRAVQGPGPPGHGRAAAQPGRLAAHALARRPARPGAAAEQPHPTGAHLGRRPRGARRRPVGGPRQPGDRPGPHGSRRRRRPDPESLRAARPPSRPATRRPIPPRRRAASPAREPATTTASDGGDGGTKHSAAALAARAWLSEFRRQVRDAHRRRAAVRRPRRLRRPRPGPGQRAGRASTRRRSG